MAGKIKSFLCDIQLLF